MDYKQLNLSTNKTRDIRKMVIKTSQFGHKQRVLWMYRDAESSDNTCAHHLVDPEIALKLETSSWKVRITLTPTKKRIFALRNCTVRPPPPLPKKPIDGVRSHPRNDSCRKQYLL